MAWTILPRLATDYLVINIAHIPKSPKHGIGKLNLANAPHREMLRAGGIIFYAGTKFWKNHFYRPGSSGSLGEIYMFKGILGIVAVSALLSIAPASAAEMMDCTDANMMKANGDMDKMPAGEKKTMGMKEMTMAKEMMAKKDMAACKTHMNKAMEMGMMK